MVTVLAGPIDKLTAGLIAGMKIADQRNRTKVLRERNQMLGEQLLMQKRQHDQQAQLNQSTITSNASQNLLRETQSRALDEGIESKNQDQLLALIDALAGSDSTPSMAEALDVVDESLDMFKRVGIPMDTPIHKQGAARLLMSSQEQANQAERVALQENKNWLAIQQGLLSVKQQEASDPISQAEFSSIRAERAAIIDREGALTQRISSFAALDAFTGSDDPDKVARLKATSDAQALKIKQDSEALDERMRVATDAFLTRRNAAFRGAPTSGGSLSIPTEPPPWFRGQRYSSFNEIRDLAPGTLYFWNPTGQVIRR